MKHKINRRYVTIVSVLMGLFIIFQLVSNFAQYMMDKEAELSVMEDIDYRELLALEDQRRSQEAENEREASYLVVGEEGNAVFGLAREQLRNLGEVCQGVKQIPVRIKGYRGIFLCKKGYDSEELKALESALKEGIPLFFLVMPEESLLHQQEIQKMLGILELKGKATHKGYRFVENFFISDMLEEKKASVTLYDVKLRQGTRTYAYSLMGERKKNRPDNEELPPMIWRSMYLEKGMKKGTAVYCVNGQKLMEGVLGFGIVTAVLSEDIQDYIYPVINGYCYLLRDFPYLENQRNEKIERLYSRDAIGVQQDILFPAITSYCRKYGLRAAYFSPDAEIIRESEEKRASYYRKEILSQVSEVAEYDRETGRMYVKNYDLQCVPWSVDFKFRQGDKTLQLPIILDGAAYSSKSSLPIEAAKAAYGFMSVYTDMEDVISDESDSDWVAISKKLDTLFRVQSQTMGYLDRMTASDCAKRIKLYQTQRMEAQKREDGMTISIDFFGGEAYYILKTDHFIDEIKNGSYEDIGYGRYLIRADAEQVEITYEQR